MPNSTINPKKRKRDETPQARFELSPVEKAGPLLVNYPSIHPPDSTPFRCYSQKRRVTKGLQASEKDDALIVVGETQSIELVSNLEETQRVATSGCRYLIAAHSKKTGAISILPVSQSPVILGRTVKALKSLPSLDAPSKTQYLEAKTNLGETFGTKKQKANIRAQERNKIDVGAMEGVMGYVMDRIDKGAEGLMTAEEMKESADNNRLIPIFDATAADPSDIYPLHNIIPEAEWKALSVSSFDAASSDKERAAMLAYRKSDWIHGHLKNQANLKEKTRRKELKMILYISVMFAFRQISFKPMEKSKIYERLNAVPSIVTDGLLEKFTETGRGLTTYQATSATKTNLLTHMFALCLKLDKFATNTGLLARDLSMPVTEVNQLFKSLGCTIKKLGEQERSRYGVAAATQADKFAILTAPVEFPKPRRKHKR